MITVILPSWVTYWLGLMMFLQAIKYGLDIWRWFIEKRIAKLEKELALKRSANEFY